MGVLLGLGAERDTPEKQSTYLLDIFTAFQDPTSRALSANYTNDLFDEDFNTRLATILWNRNDAFKDDMVKYDHEYCFASADGNTHKGAGATVTDGGNAHDENMKADNSEIVHARKKDDLPELEGILHDQESLAAPSDEDIIEWIEKLYRTSRGFKIGTSNPLLMSTIMRKQSAKWADLALGHISDVIAMIHNSIVCVLEKVCPDERVCGNQLSALMDDLTKKYSMGQIEFLLHVERSGTLMTLNDDLQENLAGGRREM